MNALLRILCAQILFGAFLSAPGPGKLITTHPWRSLFFYVFAIVYGAVIYVVLFQLAWLWIAPSATALFLLSTGLLAAPRTGRLILLNLVQLVPTLTAAILARPAEFANAYRKIVAAADSRSVLLVTLGYLAVIWPAGNLIGAATEPLRGQLEPEKARGLRHAGLWIGRLERLLAYTFILLGQDAAIAFLVTAKSVFRFGEIRDPNNRRETEYILIGSLVSFSVAMIVGYVVRMVISAPA